MEKMICENKGACGSEVRTFASQCQGASTEVPSAFPRLRRRMHSTLHGELHR